MIDAALVTWLWHATNAIPLEYIVYTAAALATVWLSHRETHELRERVRSLELDRQTIAVSLHALSASTSERLAWQDKMVDKMWSLLGVRVDDEQPANSSDSSDPAES